MAGADIFDGLNWLRYFFKGNSAIYKNEYHMDNYLVKTESDDMYKHNIQLLKKLENNLHFAINTNTFDEFEEEIDFINKVIGD